MSKAMNRMGYLAGVGAAILVITVLLVTLTPFGDWSDALIRGAALFAYLTIFVSIVSTAYMRELVRFFGGPFVRVHHIATLTALVLITLHPLGVALRAGSLNVFVPATGSTFEFFLFGGRQAWYLFGLAALAAVLRKRWAGGWRTVHWLAYIAFLFATAHGILMGISFGPLGVRVVVILMAVVSVAIYVRKRVAKPRRATPRKAGA